MDADRSVILHSESLFWLLLGLRRRAYQLACEATERQPEDASGWLARGIVERSLATRAAARRGIAAPDMIVSLTHAVECDPTLFEAWGMLAWARAAAGEESRAHSAGLRTLVARADLSPLVAVVALHLAAKDAPLEALDLMESLAALGYSTRRLLRERARILGMLGFTDDATRLLHTVWNDSRPNAR